MTRPLSCSSALRNARVHAFPRPLPFVCAATPSRAERAFALRSMGVSSRNGGGGGDGAGAHSGSHIDTISVETMGVAVTVTPAAARKALARAGVASLLLSAIRALSK